MLSLRQWLAVTLHSVLLVTIILWWFDIMCGGSILYQLWWQFAQAICLGLKAHLNLVCFIWHLNVYTDATRTTYIFVRSRHCCRFQRIAQPDVILTVLWDAIWPWHEFYTNVLRLHINGLAHGCDMDKCPYHVLVDRIISVLNQPRSLGPNLCVSIFLSELK